MASFLWGGVDHPAHRTSASAAPLGRLYSRWRDYRRMPASGRGGPGPRRSLARVALGPSKFVLTTL